MVPAAVEISYIWRRLRSLGALYRQQSVACCRPATPPSVRSGGWPTGCAATAARHACCKLALTDPGEEAAVTEQFRQERARGRVTYAEVEESEADLERFRSWLHRIQARDHFDAPGRTEAQAAVERRAAALAAFEAEALAAEAPDPSASSPAPRPASLGVATPAVGAEGGRDAAALAGWHRRGAA